jgi:hypothetical protein
MMTRFVGAIGLTVVAGALPPALDVGFPDPEALEPEERVGDEVVAADFALVEGSGVNGLRGVRELW